MIEGQIKFQCDFSNAIMWEQMWDSTSPNERVRRVEVCRSPWWKKSRPNYAVIYKCDGQLLGCENGLTRTAAIKAVKCWEARCGWMN